MNTRSARAETEYSVWLPSHYMSTTLGTSVIVVPSKIFSYKALFKVFKWRKLQNKRQNLTWSPRNRQRWKVQCMSNLTIPTLPWFVAVSPGGRIYNLGYVRYHSWIRRGINNYAHAQTVSGVATLKTRNLHTRNTHTLYLTGPTDRNS